MNKNIKLPSEPNALYLIYQLNPYFVGRLVLMAIRHALSAVVLVCFLSKKN